MLKNVLVTNSDLENFFIAAETNVHGVHFGKNLTIALKMPFPFHCQCDEFCGLDYLVKEAGSGVFHDITCDIDYIGDIVDFDSKLMSGLQAENYIDPEFAPGRMARELEPGEKAADAVDYEDMGADDSLPVGKAPSNTVEDTRTDIDFELGYDNLWERHPIWNLRKRPSKLNL